jgi:chromosome segregation ATPase
MHGFVNYETEYNSMKLHYEQLCKELESKSSQFDSLRCDYEKLSCRLPEYEEMKVMNERVREKNQSLEKENNTKSAYISGLQMKLVTAMSELERVTIFGC